MITWIIAGILATIGGALYGLDKSFKPFTYFNNMLPYICCSNCRRDREIHLELF
jgi:branched-subunit amino acid ABC-type transport system permease component